MKRSTALLIAIVIILSAVYVGFEYYRRRIVSSETTFPDNGNPAIETETVNLSDLDTRLLLLGGATKRISEYSEGILFLNFWATWCGYCEMEMPDLIKLDRQMRAEGIGKVVAIDVNEKEPVVKEYLDEMGFTELEVLLDLDGAAAKKFDIEGYPTTFVFKDGSLVNYKVGMMTWDEMSALLEQAK